MLMNFSMGIWWSRLSYILILAVQILNTLDICFSKKDKKLISVLNSILLSVVMFGFSLLEYDLYNCGINTNGQLGANYGLVYTFMFVMPALALFNIGVTIYKIVKDNKKAQVDNKEK